MNDAANDAGRERLASEISVVERQGLVIIGTPQKPFAALQPEAARLLGVALCKKAYRATFGDDPAKEVNIMNAEIRSKLITRLALVQRSLQEQGKKPEYIAEALVDIVLKEVS